MATAGGGRRKRLAAHLEAAFGEIERLADTYRMGIERLESSVRADLSSSAVRQWFQMYLRVVDLGVEIRRGEIRHRTSREFSHPCMHTTGTKGATHSGLSIDDANALYQALENSPGVRESHLEVLFMRMDALDNDRVGVLDIRLNACLNKLLGIKSVAYYALEVNGSDPHQELLVKRGDNAIEQIKRTCFRPSMCVCEEDAAPWTDFFIPAETLPPAQQDVIEIDDSPTQNVPRGHHQTFISAASTTFLLDNVALAGTTDDEVGLSELKRQFGFEPQLDSDGDEISSSLELLKRRRLLGRRDQPESSNPAVSAVRRLTPMQIYARKCRENGVEPKKKLRDLFVVTDGALNLNLSQIGFHSSENLQDLLDVVAVADLPIASLDVTNNFFNAQSFQIFCKLLQLPNFVQNVQTLTLRCVALPQRSDFPTLLRILSSSENGELVQLRELDLSYNTFSEDSVLCLDSLFTGLKRLEKLSLESCFTKAPDPEVVEVAVVKDLVRAALVTCCDQLKSLNFGSNWMSFPLLNSLFAPESALQELSITQMTFFCFETAGFDASMWDFNFQHLESLTLSETKHSRSDYLPVFLNVLIESFKTGFVQLKHLDLVIGAPRQISNQDPEAVPALDTTVVDLLQQVGEYGALQSLRVRMENPLSEMAVPNYERVIAQLLARGFPVCESLDLSLGLPLCMSGLRDLIGAAQLPKAQKLKLSIIALEPDAFAHSGFAVTKSSQSQLSFDSAFRAALGAIQEFTLEVKVPKSKRAAILSDQLIHELSEAWKALDVRGPSAASTITAAAAAAVKPKTMREVAMTKRKLRRARGSGPPASPDLDLATFLFVFTNNPSSVE